jgi:hypothetical protein
VLQDKPQTDRFGLIFIIGIVAAVALTAGLVFAFIMGADGINQSPEDLARNRTPRSTTSDSAPPATNIQPAAAGPSARLVNGGAAVEIDFAGCASGQQRFDLPAGTVTYDFLGLSSGDCIVDYGDDASAPGAVTMACRVPSDRGTVQFLVHDGRADMSGIADRCSKI